MNDDGEYTGKDENIKFTVTKMSMQYHWHKDYKHKAIMTVRSDNYEDSGHGYMQPTMQYVKETNDEKDILQYVEEYKHYSSLEGSSNCVRVPEEHMSMQQERKLLALMWSIIEDQADDNREDHYVCTIYVLCWNPGKALCLIYSIYVTTFHLSNSMVKVSFKIYWMKVIGLR